MAIRTINATIQMRHGEENDFDPDQMTTGEWAVSDDTKKVWMCFKPGFVLRMSTYEAFEEDLKEIQGILATCQSIQEAVERFVQAAEQHSQDSEIHSIKSKSWAVGETGVRDGEDTDNSEYYSRQSERNSLISKSYSSGNTGLREGENQDNSKYYSEQSASYSDLSKSWAVGNTDLREDESENNSKFFSEESKKYSDISKMYLGKVEQAGDNAVDKIQEALDMNEPKFQINLSTGHLMYEGGRFIFNVNNIGHLEWGLIV